MSTSIGRRAFLAGSGGAALCLPFLPSLSASAASPAPPRRFVFVFTANGQRPNNWWPSAPMNWTTLDANQSVRAASLAGSTGALSPVLGSELARFGDKLTLIRGLDFVKYNGGPGHAPASPLNAIREGDGVTLDQLLANASAVYESPPAVRSLHMLIKTQHESPSSCSMQEVGGQVQSVPHQTSVRASFELLFGGLAQASDDEATRRAALRGRLIDRLRGQYRGVIEHPRLGAEDAKRLEGHLALIDDLEARLGASLPTSGCSVPTPPGDDSLADEANLPGMTRKSIDLLAAALKCDRTRVSTLMLCGGTDIRQSGYLGGLGEHHELSHSTEEDDKLARINRWYAQQFAYLLEQLDVVEDPVTGSTYLDNTLIYWGNEDGCNHQDAHWGSAMPVLLAGSAGGRIKTGRYLDYRQVSPDGTSGQRILFDYQGSEAELGGGDYRGRLYNALPISILQAFGLSPSDYERGGPGFGDYAGNYKNQYALAAGQTPLPFLLV